MAVEPAQLTFEVWRGGITIWMKALLTAYGSFAALPLSNRRGEIVARNLVRRLNCVSRTLHV